MPKLPIRPHGELNYVIDDFAPPWETTPTILCVHGVAECTRAWAPWVPFLARVGRVVRMDQRGFGESTAMPEDFTWSLDIMADDVARVIEAVAPEGLHLIGAKIAGPVVLRAATRHPNLVKSLTLVGTPIVGPSEQEWLDTVEQEGVRPWAEGTMDARLKGMSDAAKQCWIDMMADTPQSTLVGFFRFVASIDARDDLGKITCPTLVIGSDNARRPISATREWQEQIANSELVTVPGQGYHAATTQPAACASAAADFISRL